VRSRLTRRFLRGLFERTASSSAGAALSAWAITTNWREIAAFSGLMAVYTVLKCFAASEVGDKDSPSLLKNAA
jgi:Putative lactococcus lactis phage r1t holin